MICRLRKGTPLPISLEHFSNSNVYQTHLRVLVKMHLLIQREACVSTFLTSSQVMATLLAHGPHFQVMPDVDLHRDRGNRVQTIPKQPPAPNFGWRASGRGSESRKLVMLGAVP